MTTERIEEWKDVIGYEGLYQINNVGNIKSSYGRRGKNQILKSNLNRYGYPVIMLCKNGKRKLKTIHSLVAESFLGHRILNKQVNHKNGIKTDNNFSNLEYLTDRENKNHAKKLNLYDHGEHHHSAKLNKKDVLKIRSLCSKKHKTFVEIGLIFNVNDTLIGQIARRKIWKHI